MSEIANLREIGNREQFLPALAALHERAVPGDFMPALGRFFLENVLYKGALVSAYANIYVCLEDSKLAGYIIYAYDMRAFLKDLLRKRLLPIVFALITKVIFRYGMLKKAFEISSSVLAADRDDVQAEILMIAVDERFRGKGIGSELLRSMDGDLLDKNVVACKSRVLSDNVPAIKMYEMHGWRRVQTIEFLNRDWINMIKEIKNDPTSSV